MPTCHYCSASILVALVWLYTVLLRMGMQHSLQHLESTLMPHQVFAARQHV